MEGFFYMGTRVSYPVEVKMKAIEMRLEGIPVKQVLEKLNIRNHSQLKTWMKWYRNSEFIVLNNLLENNIPLTRDLNMKVKPLSCMAKNR